MTRYMKDSGISWVHDIPSEWKVLKNKVCFDCFKEIIGGKSAETQLLSLTTKGIKEKRPEESTGKVPESYDTYQKVIPNDIVMCLFDLDVSAVFSGISPYQGMISPAYKVLKCKEMIIPKYADYWFSFVFDGRKFKHYSKNLRYTLTYDEFAVLPIVLPPVPEQERIVSFLDAECTRIDSVVNQTRASIEEYKKLKQTIITKAVTKGINSTPMKDSGIEWIGDIPADWEIKKTKSISNRIVVGVVIKPADYFDDNGTVPFLRGINIKEYTINHEPMVYISKETNSLLSKSIIHTNDILIVRDGSIGTACVVPERYEGSNAVSLIIATCNDNISPQYICYSFNSDVGKTQFNLTKIGTALTHTSVAAVSSIFHVLPPYEMQREIVDYLNKKTNEINSIIEKKETLLSELKDYKKSLIYEYVTGKKEVPA